MDADGCKQEEPLCFQDDELANTKIKVAKEIDYEEKYDANYVAYIFDDFINVYDIWREENGLSVSVDNAYEITSSMADKLGRICRQVKHMERNDPKPDWPDGMTEDMVGLLVYMIMLKNHYNIDMTEGMKNEMEKAVEQHSKKERE